MHTSPEPCAEVRGAGQDVSQAFVPHELPSSLLNEMLHLKLNKYDEKNSLISLQKTYTVTLANTEKIYLT